MTNDDRMAALSLAMEPQHRDERKTNIGGLKIRKRDGSSGYGLEVAELLYSRNGSYCWDRDDPLRGAGTFNSIYEAMAADIYAPGGTLRDQLEAAQEYGSNVRSGVVTLSDWFLEQWGIVLYRCKSSGSGNHVTTITVHGNLVIDEITGMTAAESQRRRDSDAVAGQIGAAYRRMSAIGGGDAARAAIRDAVESRLATEAINPRRAGLLSQGGQSVSAEDAAA